MLVCCVLRKYRFCGFLKLKSTPKSFPERLIIVSFFRLSPNDFASDKVGKLRIAGQQHDEQEEIFWAHLIFQIF